MLLLDHKLLASEIAALSKVRDEHREATERQLREWYGRAAAHHIMFPASTLYVDWRAKDQVRRTREEQQLSDRIDGIMSKVREVRAEINRRIGEFDGEAQQ